MMSVTLIGLLEVITGETLADCKARDGTFTACHSGLPVTTTNDTVSDVTCYFAKEFV